MDDEGAGGNRGERVEKTYRQRGGRKKKQKNGSDKCVALLLPLSRVVLALDNPSQTAVGDRDQIEMTDWSAARTLQHTQSNEKEIKKAFCRKKRDKKPHSSLSSRQEKNKWVRTERLEVLCSAKQTCQLSQNSLFSRCFTKVFYPSLSRLCQAFIAHRRAFFPPPLPSFKAGWL